MTRNRATSKRTQLLFGAGGALLLLADASCSKRGVCEEVMGSCLALRVEGQGPFDALRTTLGLSGGSDTRMGDTTAEPPGIELPTTLRIVPPAGLAASQVTQVAVDGLRADVAMAHAQSDASFIWPDETHIDLTLLLNDGNDVPDGGSDDGPTVDMTGPPTELKWKVETNPAKFSLFGVWAGSPTQAYAVGEKGSVLARKGDGTWATDTMTITGTLYGVSGLTGGNVWAGGDLPGAYRRDATKWTADNSGLNLGTGKLYSITVGATPGELWAGDQDGKVWHRTGSATANGTWGAFEQVLPAGTAINGIASAQGAVFAVGVNGYVAVRKDSNPGTLWTQTQLPTQPTGKRPDWQGAWAFDKNSAVVVGTDGFLVRYSGGAWQTAQSVSDQTSRLFSVWGQSDARVFVVGDSGLIIRVEGSKTTELARNAAYQLNSVYGLSEKDIFAVGVGPANNALILHGTP